MRVFKAARIFTNISQGWEFIKEKKESKKIRKHGLDQEKKELVQKKKLAQENALDQESVKEKNKVLN